MNQSRRDLLKASGIGAAVLALGGSGVTSASAAENPAAATELLPKPVGKRVVIVGGGWGFLTAARYIKKEAPEAEVIVLEKKDTFVSCPISNEWLAGEEVQPRDPAHRTYAISGDEPPVGLGDHRESGGLGRTRPRDSGTEQRQWAPGGGPLARSHTACSSAAISLGRAGGGNEQLWGRIPGGGSARAGVKLWRNGHRHIFARAEWFKRPPLDRCCLGHWGATHRNGTARQAGPFP